MIIEYAFTNPKTQYQQQYSKDSYELKCSHCKSSKVEETPEAEIGCGNGSFLFCRKCNEETHVKNYLDYNLVKCAKCGTKNLVQHKYDYGDKFDACRKCENIQYCYAAEKETDICPYTEECFLCGNVTCKHGIAKSLNGVNICKLCRQKVKSIL